VFQLAVNHFYGTESAQHVPGEPDLAVSPTPNRTLQLMVGDFRRGSKRPGALTRRILRGA